MPDGGRILRQLWTIPASREALFFCSPDNRSLVSWHSESKSRVYLIDLDQIPTQRFRDNAFNAVASSTSRSSLSSVEFAIFLS